MLALLVGLHHRRRWPRQARLRRRPALEPGPDRLPGGSRGRHLRRPAAQAVRVLHRRERTRRRGGGIRPGPRPDQPLGARHRPAQPRHHPGPQAGLATDARASSSPSSSPSRCRSCSTSRRTACRSSACFRRGFRCRPFPHVSGLRHPAAVRRGAGHLARGHRRHDLDVRRVRQARRATRWTATRSSPGSARPTSPPACSPASRSARAAHGRPSPSSRAPRRS